MQLKPIETEIQLVTYVENTIFQEHHFIARTMNMVALKNF
jgi:hypothetical protein